MGEKIAGLGWITAKVPLLIIALTAVIGLSMTRL